MMQIQVHQLHWFTVIHQMTNFKETSGSSLVQPSFPWKSHWIPYESPKNLKVTGVIPPRFLEGLSWFLDILSACCFLHIYLFGSSQSYPSKCLESWGKGRTLSRRNPARWWWFHDPVIYRVSLVLLTSWVVIFQCSNLFSEVFIYLSTG